MQTLHSTGATPSKEKARDAASTAPGHQENQHVDDAAAIASAQVAHRVALLTQQAAGRNVTIHSHKRSNGRTEFVAIAAGSPSWCRNLANVDELQTFVNKVCGVRP